MALAAPAAGAKSGVWRAIGVDEPFGPTRASPATTLFRSGQVASPKAWVESNASATAWSAPSPFPW